MTARTAGGTVDGLLRTSKLAILAEISLLHTTVKPRHSLSGMPLELYVLATLLFYNESTTAGLPQKHSQPKLVLVAISFLEDYHEYDSTSALAITANRW